MTEVNVSEKNQGQLRLVRNMKMTSRGKPMVIVPSQKSNKSMPCESINEKWALSSFENDPLVEKYITQPCSVGYKNRNGNKVRYTPDLLVKYTDGSFVFYEIKDSNWSKSLTARRKFEEVKKVFEHKMKRPLKLFVRSEHQPGRAAANLQLLKRFLHIPLSEAVNESINQQLSQEQFTFAQLKTVVEQHNKPVSYAMALVAQEKYAFDMTSIINPQTTLVAA